MFSKSFSGSARKGPFVIEHLFKFSIILKKYCENSNMVIYCFYALVYTIEVQANDPELKDLIESPPLMVYTNESKRSGGIEKF